MPKQVLSLAPQTFVDLVPSDFVDVASNAGYTHVGLRVIAVNPRNRPSDMPCLVRDMAEALRVKEKLDDRGLAVHELESVALTRDLVLSECRAGFEIGNRLGAKYLVVTIGLDDESEAVDRVTEIGILAAEYGLGVVIEFIPWRPVGRFDLASSIARRESSGNVGVLIDALHFDRVGATAANIGQYESSSFPYFQICDAPADRPAASDELLRQAFCDRLYPGEGGLDLVGMLCELDAGIPVSVEVPNTIRASRAGALHHAIAAREATIRTLAVAAEARKTRP